MEVSASPNKELMRIGDNWQIVCDGVREGLTLKGYTKFYLQHGETKRYLSPDIRNSFNQRILKL